MHQIERHIRFKILLINRHATGNSALKTMLGYLLLNVKCIFWKPTTVIAIAIKERRKTILARHIAGYFQSIDLRATRLFHIVVKGEMSYFVIRSEPVRVLPTDVLLGKICPLSRPEFMWNCVSCRREFESRLYITTPFNTCINSGFKWCSVGLMLLGQTDD